MIDQGVLARCNMFGVLKNMEYLARNDAPCREWVQQAHLAIQLNVKNGPKANLSFENGTVSMKAGRHPCQILLAFSSPRHFNRMIEGTAKPIPLKGFTRLGFLLGPFSRMADRLALFLRPTPEFLQDPVQFKMNTEMTAYAAMFSLAEIANYDEMGRACAASIPDGDIQVGIVGGIELFITAKGGRLTAHKGHSADPFSVLEFSSLESAHAILNGQLDTYTAIASGEMEMRGFIPQVEYMNPILSRVSDYLS